MCYDKYAKELGDREFGDKPLVELDDPVKITRTFEFRCTPRKRNNWKQYWSQGKLRNAGMTAAPVPLWIPFTMYYDDGDERLVAGADKAGWKDATTVSRRTAQNAYLQMLTNKFRNIESYAQAWRESYPQCEITIEILICSDDKYGYPLQVANNLTKILTLLLNDNRIDNWKDEHIVKGKLIRNEFMDEYNELAIKLFQIWKKHKVWIKPKFRPLT